MDISIMIEGQEGVNWARWRRLAAEVEQLGFAGLFRSDHFTNAGPPDKDSLEMIVSLAYLASQTSRIHFGPCVAPLSFRDPVMLARQAAAIDDLSGGRMILGVGAGWQAREHALFGYELGDVPTRMDRFEEGLEVISRLLRSDKPVSYTGRFYQLSEAQLLPHPQHNGRPPIMVGGNGPKRTLPLVARYADHWNAVFVGPEQFVSLSATLDGLLREVGRPPQSLRRTLMTGTYFGSDAAELGRRLGRARANNPGQAGLSDEQLAAWLNAERHVVAGTPEQARAQIAAYAAAGVEELFLQWIDVDDIAGLRAFARVALG